MQANQLPLPFDGLPAIETRKETTIAEIMVCLTEIAETGNAVTQPMRVINKLSKDGLIEGMTSSRRPLRITDKGSAFYADQLIFVHSPLYTMIQ